MRRKEGGRGEEKRGRRERRERGERVGGEGVEGGGLSVFKAGDMVAMYSFNSLVCH